MSMTERYHPTNAVRPDEIFWKTTAMPSLTAWGWDWLFRRVRWKIGSQWTFQSSVLLWVVRWYSGTGKIDPSQTYRLRSEQPAYALGYVVATTKKEQFSFRLSVKKPDRERWDNMGGI